MIENEETLMNEHIAEKATIIPNLVKTIDEFLHYLKSLRANDKQENAEIKEMIGAYEKAAETFRNKLGHYFLAPYLADVYHEYINQDIHKINKWISSQKVSIISN